MTQPDANFTVFVQRVVREIRDHVEKANATPAQTLMIFMHAALVTAIEYGVPEDRLHKMLTVAFELHGKYRDTGI